MTDDEIIEQSNGRLDKRIVGIYLKRFQENKEIRITEVEGKGRVITPIEKYIPKSFKSQLLEQMLEIYFEDFENSSLFEERVEIGKIMLRIIEKL